MTSDCEDLLLKVDESVKGAFLLHRAEFHDQCASRCYYAMFYAAEAKDFVEVARKFCSQSGA